MLLLADVAFAAAPTVNIEVSEIPDSGSTTYEYTVRNGSLEPIVRIELGYRCDSMLAELDSEPVGWSYNERSTSAVAQPEGWTADVTPMEHHHRGIAYLTPADVHYGRAEGVLAARHEVMLEAYAVHPERFVGGPPKRVVAPSATYINPLRMQTASPVIDTGLTAVGVHH